MGIKDIFDKVLKIGKEAEFHVRIIEDSQSAEAKDWTYIELGFYLIANPTAIERIDIILR